MSTESHSFYLALAYGIAALLMAAESLLLWRRCHRARQVERHTS